MPDFRRVTDDFYVSPQLTPADLTAAAAAGFRAVVRNRPDGEQPGQPTAAEIDAAAAAAGLASYAVPLAAPSAAGPGEADALAGIMKSAGGPVLAYCRSGTRSVTMWAMAVVRSGTMSPKAAMEAAQGAGYDLSALEPLLGGLAP